LEPSDFGNGMKRIAGAPARHGICLNRTGSVPFRFFAFLLTRACHRLEANALTFRDPQNADLAVLREAVVPSKRPRPPECLPSVGGRST